MIWSFIIYMRTIIGALGLEVGKRCREGFLEISPFPFVPRAYAPVLNLEVRETLHFPFGMMRAQI